LTARSGISLHERGFVATETLDELPGGIDFVYSSNVLEHIEDDVAALVSIRKKDEFWWSIGSVRARVQIALDKNG
jgi:hypothetical protein